jgi:hypothetical protein
MSIGDPLPSICHLAEFFRARLAALPTEKCQVCKKALLPSDPEALIKMTGKEDIFPMRAICGDVFHRICLENSIVRPPFRKSCANCSGVIEHPVVPALILSL